MGGPIVGGLISQQTLAIDVGSPKHPPHAESDNSWPDKPNKYSLGWDRNGSDTILQNGL